MFYVQLYFYTKFKVVHPWAHVGFVALKTLKPYFVWKLKDFNSCCCCYHQEMVEIKSSFNNMRATHVRLDSTNEPCMCGHDNVCSHLLNGVVVGSLICQAHHHVYKRSLSMGVLLMSKTFKCFFFQTWMCARKMSILWVPSFATLWKWIATYYEQCCRMVEVWESLG
jgi:hypothetical protein